MKKIQKFLPLFEFPSSIVVVDDNIDYLKSLKLSAISENVRVISFNDPKKALSYLNEKTYCKFKDDVISSDEENKDIFGKGININLSSLYKEIYKKDRFDEISVLIVDYAMPETNGQQFCEQISSLPIQKLLLTGEATFEDAVTMFNKGIIDKFLKKGDSLTELFETIKILQKKYFETLAKDLLSSIDKIGVNIFTDNEFINFFESLCKKNEFIEYYALDDTGSYLLADKLGNLKLLIVKSNEEMKILYEFAEGDFDAPESLLKEIYDKKKIAFFSSIDNISKPVKDWLFYDAIQINGEKETYYYALVDVGQNLKINNKEIISYNEFCRN